MSKFVKIGKICLLLAVILAFLVPGFTRVGEAATQPVFFSEGFENGDKGEFDKERIGSGDSLTYTTTRVYEGSYSLKAEVNTSIDKAAVRERLYGKADLYLQCFVYWTELPSVGERHNVIQLYDNTHSKVARLGLENYHGTYLIRVRNGAGREKYRSGSISVSTRTWYRFTLRVKLGDTDGELEAWFEDAKVIDESNLCTANGPVDMDQYNYGYAYFGICYSSEAHSVYIDSCTISYEYVDTGGENGDEGSDRSGGDIPSKEENLWSTRHKNGLDDWMDHDGGIGATPPYSDVSVEYIDGKYWGKSEVNDPTYPSDPSTDYKVRAEAYEKGAHVTQNDDVYYGVRLLLTDDFGIDDSSVVSASLVQLKEGSSYGFIFRYHIDPEYFYVKFRHYYPEQNYHTHTYEKGTGALPMIRGRPFTLIIHVKATEDGVFEMWLDGEKKITDYGDYRFGPTDASKDGGRISRYIKCGIYVNGLFNEPTHMYFTDVVVATELLTVLNFFEG